MSATTDLASAIAVQCPTCDDHVSAVVVATHDWWDREGPPALASLVKCTRCGAAMLTIQEDYGQGFGEDRPVRVWPPREPHLSFSVPRHLRGAYEEALVCFDAKAYTACAVMVRRTLEAFCVTQGAKKGSLQQRLELLKKADMLDDRLLGLGTAIREIGNDAAHDVLNSVSRQDARDLLDLCRALLEYLYDVLGKQRDVLDRREARRAQRDEAESVQRAAPVTDVPATAP